MILIQPKRVDVLSELCLVQRPRIPRGHIPSDARWYEVCLDPQEWNGSSHQVLRAWNVSFFEDPRGEFLLRLDSWRYRKLSGKYIRVDWPATSDRAWYYDGPNIRVFDLGPTPPLTLSDDDHFGGGE